MGAPESSFKSSRHHGQEEGNQEAGSASGVSKTSRDWCASTISNRDVKKLRALGFISSSDDDIHLPVLLLLNVILLHPKVGSDDDDEVPLAKRAKFFSEKADSAKESNPSTANLTPPSRTGVVKIPVSKVIPSASTPIPPAARDHPIYATVDAVADFADQFTRLESENAQLRKTIRTSADQVLEANKLTADAQNKNILLKDELKKLKKKMKDEQDARREAAAAADEKRPSFANPSQTC
ncbi:hypothetical protein QYE76_030243 [Lolium multiflorum]|uniref:Uncharacterized protein n=1 Tax=Lolium multiflorum TaxID=4521 RepID=A0AAD8QPC7_LOLMU|nr:hypothetical protein QYE76_030243 [Lolium multiflorum]